MAFVVKEKSIFCSQSRYLVFPTRGKWPKAKGGGECRKGFAVFSNYRGRRHGNLIQNSRNKNIFMVLRNPCSSISKETNQKIIRSGNLPVSILLQQTEF
jgi:hypothetical protein